MFKKISNEVVAKIIATSDISDLCDFVCENSFFSFIDKQGNKWNYTKNNNICYYSGDEHLLVMTDNATPDNIRDDKIISIY